MKKLAIAMLFGSLVGTIPVGVFAADPLSEIYERRPDLQAAFDADGNPSGPAAGFLMNLEDWARQYGWQAYPELAAYAPLRTVPVALAQQSLPPSLTAAKYIVIDDATGAILAASGAEQQWPIASITKLMTSTLVMEEGEDLYQVCSVKDVDNVGGARLYVTDGTTFTLRDALAATLVGSANNAANALARATGLSKTQFVAAMNEKVDALGLTRTEFADPTGIELGNVSTAREVAYFAAKAFENEHIRKFAGSTKTSIAALNDNNYVRDIKNTNWLLYDAAYDDLYVTAGKTGFLNESGWNLVVRMHPMGEKESERSLLIVTLGSVGRRESFDDAAALARWTWKNFTW